MVVGVNSNMDDQFSIVYENDPNTISLNELMNAPDAESLIHWRSDQVGMGKSPEELLIQREAELITDSWFRSLTEREEVILRAYLEDQMTLDEIGKQVGLGRERIRQIKDRAIRKVQELRKDSERAWSFDSRSTGFEWEIIVKYKLQELFDRTIPKLSEYVTTNPPSSVVKAGGLRETTINYDQLPDYAGGIKFQDTKYLFPGRDWNMKLDSKTGVALIYLMCSVDKKTPYDDVLNACESKDVALLKRLRSTLLSHTDYRLELDDITRTAIMSGGPPLAGGIEKYVNKG